MPILLRRFMLLLCVLCCVLAIGAEDPAADPLRAIRLLVDRKEYEAARQLIQPILQKNAHDAEALCLLAGCDEELGRKKEAAEEYARALTLLDAAASPKGEELRRIAAAGVRRLDVGMQILIKYARQMEQEADALEAANPYAAGMVRAAARQLTETSEPPKPAPAPAPVNSKAHPDDAVQFMNRWYKAFPGHMSWHEAMEECRNMGGTLATVGSASEQDFLERLLPGRDVWLGGTDQSREGVWRWTDGRPWRYTNWRKGEPNNSGDTGSEDYLMRLGSGVWNDVSAKEPKVEGFICRWEK